jgi:hypothetical protein
MTEFLRKRIRKSTDSHGFPGLESIDFGPDGKFMGYGLERSPDSKDHPCIPAGRYKIVPSVMATSGHLRALLMDVPGRTGIFWHNCNWASELLGCLATGLQRPADGQIALGIADKVYQLVAADPDKSFITIEDCYT